MTGWHGVSSNPIQGPRLGMTSPWSSGVHPPTKDTATALARKFEVENRIVLFILNVLFLFHSP